MLEFALRQERTKRVGAGGKLNSVPPTRLAALQDEDRLSTGDREGSGSECSQEDSVFCLPLLPCPDLTIF